MEFNLLKSKFIYFIKTKRIRTDILNILGEGNLDLILVENARFLNV